MTFPLDLYRTAHVLIRQHGGNATIIAAQHADACMERGDLDGQGTWRRVIAAIKELQDTSPPANPSKVN
jgi:hypothetical protein